MDTQFYIWSNERGYWWRPAQNGYTDAIGMAGKYSLEEATNICKKANYAQKPDELPNKMMVPIKDAKHEHEGQTDQQSHTGSAVCNCGEHKGVGVANQCLYQSGGCTGDGKGHEITCK